MKGIMYYHIYEESINDSFFCNNSIGDIGASSDGSAGVYVGSGVYDCNVNNVGLSSCKM